MDLKSEKSRARIQAKARRAGVDNPRAAAVGLIGNFPAQEFRGQVIGGIWPLSSEIDTRPLMKTLSEAGFSLALPCTPRAGKPLTFRTWQTGDRLKAGAYGTREPYADAPIVEPAIVLVPLLAFTQSGARLGYGGGYYDRTLAALRACNPAVFACGVGYAAQEAASLPLGPHDARLDGILTEQYFKRVI
ncbi:5-formyltetrahydrofolate cyclo-ligase [Fretibacter rubidus]|uniref:5-formyltetrahydrofolate cyclo-ligase n=1 Tax=Fretibacter rubidus TaxID=570162 RepID=UPI00352B9321